MADIRNDQYLHRPGAGRGAVTPADPLEVILYGPNEEPISAVNRLPVEATLTGSLPSSYLGAIIYSATNQNVPAQGEFATSRLDLRNYRFIIVYVNFNRSYTLRVSRSPLATGFPTSGVSDLAIGQAASSPAVREHFLSVAMGDGTSLAQRTAAAAYAEFRIVNEDTSNDGTLSIWVVAKR